MIPRFVAFVQPGSTGTADRHATAGRLEAARTPAFPVRRLARPPDRGRGRARAHPQPRHSAGVAGRLDLAERGREAPGDRGRRGGKAPVPLPPGLPRGAGAGEVRAAPPLREVAADAALANAYAPGARPVRARLSVRDRRLPRQPRLVPGR